MNDVLIIAAIVAATGGAYYVYKKHQKKVFSIEDVPSEIVDGEVKMVDIVGVFKSLNLEKGKDTPFIAKNVQELFNFTLTPEYKLRKESYETLFLGVYNESVEKLSFAKIIYAKQFDEQLSDVLNQAVDGIVVLS